LAGRAAQSAGEIAVLYSDAGRARGIPLRGAALLLGSALLIYGANAIGLTMVLAVLALSAGLATLVFRFPSWAAVFFVAFVPVNRFVIQAAFHLAGLDDFARLAFLWRDGLMLVLLARVIWDALFSAAPRRILYVDILVLFFLLLSLVYLAYPGSFDTDLLTRVQGFRTDASFLVAYFVGRGLTLRPRHARWLVLAIIPGSLLVAAVAAWQFAAPAQANAVFDALGLRDARERGIAGVDLTRASSLLLGDLALSFYQIFLVALSSALFFEVRGVWRQGVSGGFVVGMIGTLALTITRSSILAAAVVVAVAALVSRAFRRFVVLSAVCGALGLVVIAASGLELEYLQRLGDPGEASAQARLIAASKSFDIAAENPLGQGLGTAGTIGQRYLGSGAITNESWYLQLLTEMGPLSAALYLAITVVIIIHALIAYIRLRQFWLRVLALSVGSGGLGFLVVSNFLHAWENTVLSMLFWLCAGIVVRAKQLEAQWQGAR
jgi:hypothetical protein